MTTVLDPPKVKEVFTDGVLLHNISWDTYEGLLRDNPETRSLRLTYDRGDLLIMVTSLEHEEISDLFHLLINLLAEEFEVESRSFGSATYKRKDRKQGFEPDCCFYFKHQARMRGKKRFDPARDPAPELIVEIDITSPSIKRLPIFAAFGVAEVWRFDGEELEILILHKGEYSKSDYSPALPKVNAKVITGFIRDNFKMAPLEWKKRVRSW
ncbi:MAG TPA: Uma2 family endonuclease, partial [Pyrinomonadaceae bacterium]|nr:Uma2 family endonuclease [Pyrinomonadaceae bacterium]